MGVLAIFIDGPLAAETRLMPDYKPVFEVMLPKRVTRCVCDLDFDTFEKEPERFTYYLIMKDFDLGSGQGIALYSKHKKAYDAIVNSLKYWVVTDLTSLHDKRYYTVTCQSRRAFE